MPNQKKKETHLNDNGLTEKEQIFCDALLSDPGYHLGKAAIAAGVSKNCSCQYGWTLHNKPRVREYLEKRKRERMAAMKIDADYVLYELVEMREMRISEIFNDDLSVKPLNEWPDSWLKNVSALDVTELGAGDIETFIKKLKIPDKHKVLIDIGKHTKVNAFNEVETGNNDRPIQINITEAVKPSAD